MNKNHKKNILHRYGFIFYTFIVFIAVNILIFSWFNFLTFDVTDEGRFSVSDNSLKIINNIPERVDLKLYISDAIMTQMPSMKNYANRVKDYLAQLEKHSNNRLKVTATIVQPFSKIEEQILAMGLKAVPVQNQKTGIFFGIIAENMIDGEGVIPFLNPEREAFIEYDIARLIQGVIDMKRITVAIASSLPLETGIGGVQGVLNGTSQPYYVFQVLQKNYNLVGLSEDYHELLDEKNRPQIAVILHPRPLSKEANAALKIYLATGGRALIAVDPFSETEPLPLGSQQKNAEIYSDMPQLFKSIGVLYDHHKIALDHHHAQEIMNPSTLRPATHLELLQYNHRDNFNRQNPAMSTIKKINVATTGLLSQDLSIKNNLTYTPLIYNMQKSGTTTRSYVSTLQDRSMLHKAYKATMPYNTAMLVTGTLEAPKKDINDNADNDIPGNSKGMAVIVIADSDLLDNRLWLQKISNSGELVPYADNLNLVLNYIDFLSGDEALLSLRGKKLIDRPLTYLDNIKKQGQKKFTIKEQQLQTKIAQLRKTIQKLNQDYSSASATGLPDNIQKSLEKFSQDLIISRTQLREVRRAMNVDLQNAERIIKLINMLFMPCLFGIIAIVILWIRQSKATHKSHEG
ncbi:MAG: ABC-type uncharacterized transport system involved in gliding motility auxiliary subunit [Alphaproteobacteria bacterium]|jgi:ABC-type uncharacterized transport system involved in gliding motility auxiliary subunit